jgi:hypothetical protein
VLPELSAEVLARLADGASVSRLTVGVEPSGAFVYTVR